MKRIIVGRQHGEGWSAIVGWRGSRIWCWVGANPEVMTTN
jgi:hypothetical protein